MKPKKNMKKTSTNLPSNYSETIPRVSEIVSYFYPFSQKDFFSQWLSEKWISYNEYMKEATDWWTYIHKKIEEYWETKKIPKTKNRYSYFVKNWISFLNDYNVEVVSQEEYILSTKYNFQGTIDLIAKIDWEDWLLDWKTYSLAKHKFNLDIKYSKPYTKLKKATLQLSLYALTKWIKNIWIIELAKDRYYFHKLKLMDKKVIIWLLKQYGNKDNEAN